MITLLTEEQFETYFKLIDYFEVAIKKKDKDGVVYIDYCATMLSKKLNKDLFYLVKDFIALVEHKLIKIDFRRLYLYDM